MQTVYIYPTDAQRLGLDTVYIMLILLLVLLAYTPKAKHIVSHPT